MRKELIQAEIELLLANSNLSQEDRVLWINVLNNSPEIVQIIFIGSVKTDPSILAFATENLKLKLKVYDGTGDIAAVAAQEKDALQTLMLAGGA